MKLLILFCFISFSAFSFENCLDENSKKWKSVLLLIIKKRITT